MARKAGGRPRKAAHQKKIETILIRVTKRLKDGLQAAAKRRPGRLSLSRECELRLQQTFDSTFEADRVDKLRELFGGDETFGVFLACALLKRSYELTVNGLRKDGRTWKNDRAMFDQLLRGMEMIWRHRAPEGESPSAPDIGPLVRGLLEDIQLADPTPPLSTETDIYSDWMKVTSAIKACWGGAIERKRK